MKRRTFAFQDPDAGLEGEASCWIDDAILHLELWLEERGFGTTSFEASFNFDASVLNRKLKRLAKRAEAPARCPSLHSQSWPTRPFAWMRRNCRYLGSLRAATPHDRGRGQTFRRLLLIAVVPRKNKQVLEIVIEGTETSVHVPVCFLERFYEATGS